MHRIHGIDIARGLAVIGMITAHVGPDHWPFSTVLQVFDGRSAALFVTLSGLSVALMSGRQRPVVGTRRVQVRTRLLVRAMCVLAIGVALVVLDTPVAVILPTYAVLFALCVPLLGARPAGLLVAAAGVAVGGPVLRHLLWPTLAERSGDQLTGLLVGDYYPVVVWFAYVLVGLAIGRTDLGAARTRWTMAGIGAGLTVLGYGSAAVLTRVLPTTGPLSGAWDLVTAAPHSSTTPEVVGNVGVAVLMLAVCLWLGDVAPRVTAPLSATGALALTAYVGHVVAIAVVGDTVVWLPTTVGWLAFLVVTVGLCWLWQVTLGRGPLERLLHGLAARASDVSPDLLPPDARVPGVLPPTAPGPPSTAPGPAPAAAWPPPARPVPPSTRWAPPPPTGR